MATKDGKTERNAKVIAQVALEEEDVSTETDSDLSISDESDSDEDVELPSVLPPPNLPSRRGRGACTRGGLQRTSNERCGWSDWASSPFIPTIPPFDANPGPIVDLPETVKDHVHLLLTDELVENIVGQSNLYARQFLATATPSVKSRVNDWKPVTEEEMRHYIALSILMGVNSLPSISDHWSTDVLFHNPVFKSVMSRNRYQIISKFLHFANNKDYDANDPNRDRLYKIRPLLDYLVRSFQDVYYPSKNVSIDEQLLLHKGNLKFKQYIPSKRARFGIKFFSLCDRSGYLYNTEIYAGKNGKVDQPEEWKSLGLTGQVVMRLMEPILGNGHALFVDNWFTSPKLFRHLKLHQTSACGTLRKNRAQFPVPFTTKKMRGGETSHLVNDQLLALRFYDKRDVYFLSTMHRTKLIATKKKNKDGDNVMNEQLVDDYNQNMRNVDKNDAITCQHTIARKCQKWTTKVAFHLFEEALFNAHVLYGFSGQQPLKYTEFKLAYVKEIIANVEKFQSIAEKPPRTFQHHHFPQSISVTNPKYPSPIKRCVNCHKKGIRKNSRYECNTCLEHPGLCPDPCFKEHHTLV